MSTSWKVENHNKSFVEFSSQRRQNANLGLALNLNFTLHEVLQEITIIESFLFTMIYSAINACDMNKPQNVYLCFTFSTQMQEDSNEEGIVNIPMNLFSDDTSTNKSR